MRLGARVRGAKEFSVKIFPYDKRKTKSTKTKAKQTNWQLVGFAKVKWKLKIK